MSAPTVLVIEDHPPLRRMVAVTLQTAGYEVLEAADGREALLEASRKLPDVVIQDLMLPDLEASSLLASLRALPGAEQLPVLAVSGSEEKLDLFSRQAASFTELLFKPVEPRQLLEVVARYVKMVQAEAHAGGGRRVLLVDDDQIQRKLVHLRLELLGFIVAVAENGRDALALAHEFRPDVIVSDVLMPVLDGFELCHAVRSDAALAKIPVLLASSAYIAAEDRRLAMRAGANALVERSPDLTELIDGIAGCLTATAAPASESLDFAVEHAGRIRAQLDLQASENRVLREAATLSAADLSVLAGVSSVVIRSGGSSGLLTEALSRCLEAGGLSAGIVRLNSGSGELVEAAHAGRPMSVEALRLRLREAGNRALHNVVCFDHARRATDGAAICAPLGTQGEPLGVLGLSWGDTEISEPRMAFTRAIAGQLGEAIALQRAFQELDSSREETIARLALAAELRDDVTARHTERVSAYSVHLASKLGLGSDQVKLLRLASVMHDVGKIGVSDTILLKPGPLTPDEYDRMKLHTTLGHKLLAGSDVELLDMAATIALTHHERFDGTGYPNGLLGTEIPIEGRIVAVADVFDALTTDRVYRPALSVDVAIAAMLEGRGTHFDPQLLDILVETLDEVLGLKERCEATPPVTAYQPAGS
jgi:response regulator RpfG family c-di-GMP phosphodiesterase